MSTQSEFDRPFGEVLVENTAQEVYKQLKMLRNARDDYRLRWIWELLQNASDAAPEHGARVSVFVTERALRFCHDGKPFTQKNIGHLIYHGSTKQEDLESAGQFGTGFMTTHLISDTVRVRGELVDGRRFDFDLRRVGNFS